MQVGQARLVLYTACDPRRPHGKVLQHRFTNHHPRPEHGGENKESSPGRLLSVAQIRVTSNNNSWTSKCKAACDPHGDETEGVSLQLLPESRALSTIYAVTLLTELPAM